MKTTIQKHEGNFPSSTGISLFYRSWTPTKKKGVIIIVHGLAEHSGRYDHVGTYFAEKGWAVYSYDHRGHGKSLGKRCYVKKFSELVEDLKTFHQFVQQKEKVKNIFIIGHSMGGQILGNFLSQNPTGVLGAVLASPNMKLAMDLSFIKKKFAFTLAGCLPSIALPNDIDPIYISRDPQVVRDYKKDKLVNRKITLGLGTEILKNLNEVMGLAEKIKIPCLIIHGSGDKITSLEGSKEFFQKLKIKDRTFKTYPKFYHETFNEIGKEKVFKDIEKWLEARAS